MSTTTSSAPRTRTAPPRRPGGWPWSHARYRNYMLFGLTSIFMGISALFLLAGVRALGRGEQAWQDYLAWLGMPAVFATSLLCLPFTLYFTIRWAWLTRKIAAGRVGPIPGPKLPLFTLFLGVLVAFAVGLVVTLMIVGGAWL